MSIDCIRHANETARGPCVASLITDTQVTVRLREWEGRVGAGVYADTDFVIPARYPVQSIKSSEIASSNGRYAIGDVRVSDLTKPYTVGLVEGGYTREQLHPQLAFGVRDDHLEELYILKGGIQGVYALVDLEEDDVVSWSLVLRRTRLAE